MFRRRSLFPPMALLAIPTLAALVGLATCRASGQDPTGAAEAERALPEGPGLAANYPGDAGIERDRRVLFAENFEKGEIADLSKHWEEVNNQRGKVLELADDVSTASAGKRSLQVTGTLGANSGGHLYTRFADSDKAFVRFYTKFAPDHGYEHHFVELGGYHPSTAWPHPKAGQRPNGDDRVMIFIDPIGWYGRHDPPGAWGLYSYWPEMKVSADGNYWGNVLQPARPALAKRGEWTCVELMVQLNSAPDERDGEMALWIDGAPVMHFAKGMRRGPWSGMGLQLVESGGEPFEGLLLRTSMDLHLNHVWLEHYVDEGAQKQNGVKKPNRVNRVWFDDVVVSTEYIGPIATEK
jgi:hypothetical protein